MSARDEVLARIRTALGNGRQPTLPGAAAKAGAGQAGAGQAGAGQSGAGLSGAGLSGAGVPRSYRTHGEAEPAALLEQLADRLIDYRATVQRVAPEEVPGAVGGALTRRGVRRMVVPPGLSLAGPAGVQPAAVPAGPAAPGPAEWPGLPTGIQVIEDDGLSAAELDTMDGVITTAAVAIAETGTIILDGSPGQGRRALSLIPDYHLCLLRADQVVALVPEALTRLDPGRPLTWISGPSATSDIELDRVEGVHGPRTLEVILIGPGGWPQVS